MHNLISGRMRREQGRGKREEGRGKREERAESRRVLVAHLPPFVPTAEGVTQLITSN